MLLFCLIFAVSASVSAQLTTNRDGKLDRSFGTNGLSKFVPSVELGAYEGNQDIALTPDGKLLTIHVFRHSSSGLRTLIRRFLGNGMPDVEFGTNGILVLSDWPSFTAIRIIGEPDGKIVLAGLDWNGIDFMILRLLSTGEPDPSFGVNGVFRKDFSVNGGQSNDLAHSIIRLPDGKYVVSGISDRFVITGPTNTYVSIIRLNSDGSLDTTYANGGISILVGQDQSTNINPFEVTQSFRTDDGKVTLASLKQRLVPDGKGQVRPYLNLIRLLPNGDLDVDFSDDGIVDFVEVFPAPLAGMKVLENGNIFISTAYETKRFHSNGIIDLTFSYPSLPMQTYNLSISENGRIFIGGLGFGSDLISGVVRRLYPDGTLDTKFGQNGVSQIRLDLETHTAILKSVVDNSGNLVVLGENSAMPTRTFFIARIFTSRKL